MKTSRCLIALACFLIFSAAPSALMAADATPFPEGMKIVPPDPGAVPEKLAEFSGIWEGRWEMLYGRTQEVALAVVKIAKDQALVVHSWGKLETEPGKRGGIHRDPGWKRYPGCPVEKGADGNYVITVPLAQGGRLILKQTSDKGLIHVTRAGAGGQVADQTMPFTKKK